MADQGTNSDVQHIGFPSLMDLPLESAWLESTVNKVCSSTVVRWTDTLSQDFRNKYCCVKPLTRAKIFCSLKQKHIPNARLVCRQWRDEIDRHYEFCLSIFADCPDFLDKIYEWRCSDCTVWVIKTNLDNRGLFRYPKFIKRLKIYGPLAPNNLQRLISDFINLEQLTISRRVSCPWILNLSDTPDLAHLYKLKHLCLNSENYLQVQRMKGDLALETTYNLPMVDCYFPVLEDFEVFKRYPKTHSVMVATYILKFLARHARTIKNIDISLHPLSTRPRSAIEAELQRENGVENAGEVGRHYSLGRDISADTIDLESLRAIRLNRCTITTNGSTRDVSVWKNIFENQDELEDFKFEWLHCDHGNGIRERVAGFPWTYLRMPVIQSRHFLVTVELVGLSMIGSTNGTLPETEILPFDASIFRNCYQLKNLTLRCQENHGMVAFPVPPEMFEEIAEEEQILDLMDFPEVEPEEVPLLINGCDLPMSIEKLEISSFRMFTTDLEDIFEKCVNLTTLFLKDVGRSGALGVTSELISRLAKLEDLQFLQILGFNEVGNSEQKTQLERICQELQIRYCGDDTEILFDSASSCAYVELKKLNYRK